MKIKLSGTKSSYIYHSLAFAEFFLVISALAETSLGGVGGCDNLEHGPSLFSRNLFRPSL